jgi:hypothetical protein
MNRADAIVMEALGGKPDPKREYTLVNEKGRSQHELADEGWQREGVAEDMLVMSRVAIVPEPKLEPVAAKAKPPPPKPPVRLTPKPTPMKNKPVAPPRADKPNGRPKGGLFGRKDK